MYAKYFLFVFHIPNIGCIVCIERLKGAYNVKSVYLDSALHFPKTHGRLTRYVKLQNCKCAGNARKVFPASDFKLNH